MVIVRELGGSGEQPYRSACPFPYGGKFTVTLLEQI
jgi:hypothetical protein